MVMFSKSGSTTELLTLIPYARAKGATLVGVSSNAKSKLAKETDMHVMLPLERELCPFDLAPVTRHGGRVDVPGLDGGAVETRLY